MQHKTNGQKFLLKIVQILNSKKAIEFEKLKALPELDHPSIAKYYQVGQDNNFLYIICETMEEEKQKLIDYIWEKRLLSETQIANIAHQLLMAL